MRRSRVLSITVLVLLLLAFAGTVSASSSREFETDLAGKFEVPVRVTDAEGEAEFKLVDNGTKIRFKLKVEEITNVWMAHIHLAPAGINGPIVVWLYPRAAPPPAQAIPGEFDGELAEGYITATDLTGPLAGQPLSALIAAMSAGNTYVNVHTNDFVDPANTGPGDFPGGEIRGQLHEHD
ncbi:MAG: CHRD domain-containing protein [Caldilinea sp. CFX5]|nr:CHRD domain-containing protein [Caldilinea sp. CFX5]